MRTKTRGKRRPRESEAPRGKVAMVRGDQRDRKKHYTTIRPRRQTLNFVISHYVSEGYSGFRCEEPGGAKKSWGIERKESDRVWPAPSQSVPMEAGYVYIFRVPTTGDSKPGRLVAAFEVHEQKYKRLQVSGNTIEYGQTQGDALSYATTEYYIGLSQSAPSHALCIIDSPIRLSNERLFGKNGLIHDPAQRGISFSAPLSCFGDFPPMGQPPAKDEIDETYGPEVWGDNESMPCQALDEDWKRHRRYRFENGISLVELFSPDPFAEGRRRNANFAYARKQQLAYKFEARRAQLAFLAQAVDRLLTKNPDHQKHVNLKLLRSWQDKDRKRLRELEDAVDEASKVCVDWVQGDDFQQRLIDFTHAEDDEIQHQSMVAYMQAVADLNSCKYGKEYLHNEYYDPESFFNAAVGFGRKNASKPGTSIYGYVRLTTTLMFKAVELFAAKILEDSKKPGFKKKAESKSRLFDPFRDQAKVLERAQAQTAAKADAIAKANAIAEAKAQKLKHPRPKVIDEQTRRAAREVGHRGVELSSGFVEERTGLLLESLMMDAQTGRLKELSLLTEGEVKRIKDSGLVETLGLSEASGVVEDYALRPNAASLKNGLPNVEASGAKEAATGKDFFKEDEWERVIGENRSRVLNHAFVALDLLVACAALVDYQKASNNGEASQEDFVRLLGNWTDLVSSSATLAASYPSWTNKIGTALGKNPGNAALRQIGHNAVMEAIEDGGGFVAKEVLEKSQKTALEIGKKATIKKLQQLSGITGAISGAIEVFYSSNHAMDEAAQGDTDAMWGWVVTGLGGGLGFAAGVATVFFAGSIAVPALVVGSFACGLAGAIMVALWDDDDTELWLQKCHFGITNGPRPSLLQQIDRYYQVMCKARVISTSIDDDGVHIEFEPRLLLPDMKISVHVQETSPPVFVDSVQKLARGTFVHKNAGCRVYNADEFEPNRGGGFKTKKHFFRSPQRLHSVSGTITVSWARDPAFKLEAQFNSTRKGL